MPIRLLATCQVAPDRVPKGTDRARVAKTKAYLPDGATHVLNRVSQIPQRFAGTELLPYTRNLRPTHFGLAFESGRPPYRWDVSATNEGSPTVDSVSRRARCFEPVSGKKSGASPIYFSAGLTLAALLSNRTCRLSRWRRTRPWTTTKTRAGRFAFTATISDRLSL